MWLVKADYNEAKNLLLSLYRQVSEIVSEDVEIVLSDNVANFDCVFLSKTQSYREVLLGCALIHRIDSRLNLRTPYAKQGANAFSGRTFDEQVVNPFLQENLFPCSKN